jgi:hypothetical protein
VLRIGGERLARGKKRVPERNSGRPSGQRDEERLRGPIERLNVPLEEGLSTEKGPGKERDRAETQNEDEEPEFCPPVRDRNFLSHLGPIVPR